MAGLWVVLSTTWQLEDLQAALNVIISVLSTVGVFAFTQSSWLMSARTVALQQKAPLSSLLTITTFGEARDTLQFLRTGILAKRHRRIALQCFVVVLLSSIATLSGPIARYASGRGQIVRKKDISGSMAWTWDQNLIEANVVWNRTQDSLDRAKFPLNQLLDFLPTLEDDWLYVEDEWNSTWAAECDFTKPTAINLTATGNHTFIDGWVYPWQELHGLQDVTPEWSLEELYTYGDWDLRGYHTWKPNDGYIAWWEDVVLFLVITKWSGSDLNYPSAMKISIAAIHLHWAPYPQDGSSVANFGKGPAAKAIYTKAACQIMKVRTPPDDRFRAFPDTSDVDSLVNAYGSNYGANIIQKSSANQEVSIPTGQGLFRFYQVYHVTKDTGQHSPVTRMMSVQVPTVELSTIFLTVIVLVALLIGGAITNYYLFLLRHRSAARLIPESKLDWLLQAMRKLGSDQESSTSSKRALRPAFEAATFRSWEKASGITGTASICQRTQTSSKKPQEEKKEGVQDRDQS